MFQHLDGFLGFPHFLEHDSEFIEQFFFLVVEDEFFFERILKRAGRKIVHTAAGKTLAQIIQGLNAAVRIILGFLKFLNGVGNLSRFKIKRAEFKTDLQVIGVFLRAPPALINQERIPLGFQPRYLLVVVKSLGIQLVRRMIELSQRGFHNRLFQRRIHGPFESDDPIIIFERAIKLLLLRVKLCHRAQQFKIVRFRLDARLIFQDEPARNVVAFHLTPFLLQGDRFCLVLEDIPIGSGAVGKRVIAAFRHGSASGKIFHCQGNVGVIGPEFKHLAVGGFCFGDVVLARIGLRQFDPKCGIFRGCLHENLQGENRSAGQVRLQGCVGE